MKFNWRANWEILLVLVIIVVGIVITTIAAIRNKGEFEVSKEWRGQRQLWTQCCLFRNIDRRICETKCLLVQIEIRLDLSQTVLMLDKTIFHSTLLCN